MAAEWENKLQINPPYIPPDRDLTKVYEAWEDFKQVPFPAAARGQEVNGIDLELLRSKLTDCIQTYLDSGLLDGDRTNMLEDYVYEKKNRVLPLLLGDAAAYFEWLYCLGELILNEAQHDYMGSY